MMRTKLILSFFILFLFIPAAFVEERPLPQKQNQLLKEELALAKTLALYFIIDVERKNISLKSRGVLLEEWKIENCRFWGDYPLLKTLTLIKKSTLFPPKRSKIKPGAAEEGNSFELEALELRDMPSTYVLYLSEGVCIYIRSKATKFISRVGNVRHLFNWYLWVPLRNLRHELRKKPFTAIDIKLGDKEKAQALYWALADGTKGLVFRLLDP